MASARFAPGEDARLLTAMSTSTHPRKEPRVFVKMPVRLNLAGDTREHIGFVRDMSEHGIFFYSDLNPVLGSQIEFVMHLPQHTMQAAELSCRGIVVRVESHTPGAATGVAVRLDECNPVTGN